MKPLPACRMWFGTTCPTCNRERQSRNGIVLADFVKFCEGHPQLRFWQALVAWAGQSFIVFSDTAPAYTTAKDNKGAEVVLEDTFYREGK